MPSCRFVGLATRYLKTWRGALKWCCYLGFLKLCTWFLVPVFGARELRCDTTQSCHRPVWFSALSPATLGVELFAVTGMLRNGIAIYGNRAFLCTASCLFVGCFFPLLLMMSVIRKEDRTFCFK